MKRLFLLIGPIVFLAAQLLWPGGSADNAQRVELIRQNTAMWQLSHQLFVLAFALLVLWLITAFNVARGSALAAIGAFCAGFALLADYAIAIEQIMSVALVTSALGAQAPAIIGAWRSDPNFFLLVLLPYTLGFLIGLPALGVALWRAGASPVSAILIGLAGVLLVAGGVTGVKLIFITAAAALVTGSALLALAASSAAVVDAGSTQPVKAGRY